MTIEQKVGQMFLVDLLQLDASPSVDGTAYKATDSMKQAIIDYHLGGVYLTKENIKSQKQTKNWCRIYRRALYQEVRFTLP